MAKKNTWKNREGVVYSTSDDSEYTHGDDEGVETLPPQQQNLRVMLDKKQRAGKQVTLVTGFVGQEEDLKDLGKKLKTRCGTGGSAKDGEIIIQGDCREVVYAWLLEKGYKAKKVGYADYTMSHEKGKLIGFPILVRDY